MGSVRTRVKGIEVPVFSGERKSWESFRDLFQALVHNDQTLSEVDQLAVTGENYTAA